MGRWDANFPSHFGGCGGCSPQTDWPVWHLKSNLNRLTAITRQRCKLLSPHNRAVSDQLWAHPATCKCPERSKSLKADDKRRLKAQKKHFGERKGWSRSPRLLRVSHQLYNKALCTLENSYWPVHELYQNTYTHTCRNDYEDCKISPLFANFCKTFLIWKSGNGRWS